MWDLKLSWRMNALTSSWAMRTVSRELETNVSDIRSVPIIRVYVGNAWRFLTYIFSGKGTALMLTQRYYVENRLCSQTWHPALNSKLTRLTAFEVSQICLFQKKGVQRRDHLSTNGQVDHVQDLRTEEGVKLILVMHIPRLVCRSKLEQPRLESWRPYKSGTWVTVMKCLALLVSRWEMSAFAKFSSGREKFQSQIAC
jgi:hypothetical protein